MENQDQHYQVSIAQTRYEESPRLSNRTTSNLPSVGGYHFLAMMTVPALLVPPFFAKKKTMVQLRERKGALSLEKVREI